MPFNVNDNIVITDDRIVQSVSGAVGARPGTPVTGMMFFNTTDSIMEVYNGTTWISTTVGGGGSAVPNAYAWGSNSYGQLGDNTVTTASKSSPVSVVGGFTDWISVGGEFHTIAIRANGTLWAWGSNSFGQLGDNSIVNKSSPVSVLGGFTDWIKISAINHTLGVRANGTLYAWGFNTNGRLGDNTTTNKSSPVLVVGGFVDWVSASAGFTHSLGVRANGTLWAWGNNSDGQLGDNSGTTASKSSPVAVVGGFTDWVSASAAGSFSLGLRANGTLWAWGTNGLGRLGDNTVVNKSSPVAVVGGFTNWVAHAASANHSLAVRANGTLWAWGSNASGILGDGTAPSTTKSSPVSVIGGFTDWVGVSTSDTTSNAIRANGTLWAWGTGSTGKLGDNSVVNKSSPVSVVGGFTDWVSVESGQTHTVGIRA